MSIIKDRWRINPVQLILRNEFQIGWSLLRRTVELFIEDRSLSLPRTVRGAKNGIKDSVCEPNLRQDVVKVRAFVTAICRYGVRNLAPPSTFISIT